MGRWSGVVFRDRGGIYLQSYTGEKYNLQHKDVMIAQAFKGARYTGRPKVNFASVMDMVEKDGWVFVHNDEAYAAVRVVMGGYYWQDLGRHELYLKDQYSPIIIQTGRKAVYGPSSLFELRRGLRCVPRNTTLVFRVVFRGHRPPKHREVATYVDCRASRFRVPASPVSPSARWACSCSRSRCGTGWESGGSSGKKRGPDPGVEADRNA